MKTVKIWRVENKNGNRLPEPDEICGFRSLSQAKRWFSDDDLKILKTMGFILKQRAVFKITAMSKYQVLAIPK